MANGPTLRVQDIRDRSEVRGAYLVRTKMLRTARNGKSYLSIELSDRTGIVEARVWDDAERYDGLCGVGDVVTIVGRASTYQGQLQVSVEALDLVPPGSVAIENYLPCSDFALDDLMAALRSIVADVRDPWLRALLDAIVGDPAFAPRLRLAPAAKVMHHAYLGGLVEHAVSMCRAVLALHGHYERLYPGLLDRDLLVAGVVLHDVGKVLEIGADAAFDYTDHGRLVGHIVQGVELINEAARRIEGFPADRLAELKHLVVAHHGKLEFGSPRTPAMAEAFLLHFVDMIDARLNGCYELCRREAGRPWTGYSRMLEAALRNPFAAVPTDEEGRPLLPEREADWLRGAPQPPEAAPEAEGEDSPPEPGGPRRRRRPTRADDDGEPDEGPQNLSLF